jgi:hypothetical protein
MKSPNRNKLKRWVRQGIWEDMDGNFHLDVPGVHQWMREHGFPITDTKAEIEDTILKMQQLLEKEHGIPADKLIIRRSRKE